MAAVEKKLEKFSKNSSDSAVDALEVSTGINEKKLLRKLDRKLLPPVTLLYLLSFLDRSNGKVRELISFTSSLTRHDGSGQCTLGRLGGRFAHE